MKTPLTTAEAVATLKATAQTTADLVVGFWSILVQMKARYFLGGEAWLSWGGPDTSDPLAGDCSGDYWSNARMADSEAARRGWTRILWKDGGFFRRTTAHGYYLMGTRAIPPYRTMDYVIFKRPDKYNSKGRRYRTYRARHIAVLGYEKDGAWRTFEARRGVEEHTLDAAWDKQALNKRKYYLGVFRLPWLPDLGQVTLPSPPLFRTLRYGCWGRDVKRAKQEINRHGFRQSTASWTYWHNTERDVKLLQGRLGLPATGDIDNATWQAMLAG